MSLKEIERLLDINEKILWHKRESSNRIRRFTITFFFYLFFIFLAILTPIIVFIIGYLNNDLLDLTSIGFLFILFYSTTLVFVYFLYYEYRRFKLTLKSFKLDGKDMANFIEFYILTNKRWIQRSFYFINKNVIENFQNIIKFYQGYAFLNLKNISVVYIFQDQKKIIIIKNFFYEWHKMHKEANLVVNMDKKEFI